MTEDDTFARLKRMPYEEVHALYSEWFKKGEVSWTTAEELVKGLDEFFKPYGWTWESYLDAWDRSIGL